MKSVRVVLSVVALLALPFGSAAAQGTKPKPRTQSENECKPEHRAAIERARAEGREIPPGLAAKCSEAPPPPPPSSPPPTGPHRAMGVVYEDINGDGDQNVFDSEMGLAGWTVQLWWNGQLVASTASAGDGSYTFLNLGIATYSVCVVGQGGYMQASEPANRNACGGAGVTFSITSSVETWNEYNFGWTLQ